jgi:hypothetical protein
MRPWHPPVQKTKKSCQNFQTPFFKKGWTITHEKYHFLLAMDFLPKKITALTSNFT